MKILVVNNTSQLNGSSLSMKHLVNNIKKTQHVTVVLPDRGPITELISPHVLVKYIDIPILRRSIPSLLYYIPGSIVSLIKILKYLKYSQFDIIHINTVTNMLYGIAGKIMRKNIVYHIREIPGFYPRFIWKLYGFIVSRTAKATIPCSKTVGELFGFHCKYMYPVQNAVDIKTNIVQRKRMSSPVQIATFANEGTRKGLIYLLKAVNSLIRRDCAIKLYIYAAEAPKNTAKGKMISDYVENNGLRKHIYYVGLKENIDKYIQSHDIFVVPSLYEAFPRSVIEAMAAGVPVIATDTGGTRDVLIHKQTGLLVQPRNEHDLSQAIRELIDNQSSARLYANNAFQHVKEHNNPELVAQEILKIYRKL